MSPYSGPAGELRPIEDLACGALAGTTARVAVAPLDVLKIRFQVQTETHGLYRYASMGSALRNIVAKEGVFALWKGNVPALLMVAPYASLQFAAFYQIKKSSALHFREPYRSLAIGGLAGAFATLCTYPLDLLRTRLAAQTEPRIYLNMRHAVQVIYRQHGVLGFFAGLRPTLIEIVPYIALQFATYERAKAVWMQRTNSVDLKAWKSLVAGAVTGTLCKLVTFPLDTAKKLMQVQGQFADRNPKSKRYLGVTNVLIRVWHRDGLRGWFRGVTPSLIKAAPNSAITFAMYEATKRLVVRRTDLQ